MQCIFRVRDGNVEAEFLPLKNIYSNLSLLHPGLESKQLGTTLRVLLLFLTEL